MDVKLPSSRGLRFVLALGLVLALLAADGVYAGLRFRSSFKAAACNLKRATDRIEDLDLDRGIERLRMAEELVAASRGYLGHPAVAVATYVPWMSSNVRALKSLSGVAREAVQAGLGGAAAAETMGLAGEGSLSALYKDGQVQFDTLAEGSAAITEALERLDRAEEILEGSPRPSIGQIRSAFFGAQRIVRDALAQLTGARDVLDALPGLLGANGPRRYFLAFQTPSEARGGGGLVGVYGVLNAEDGRLDLEKVAPIRELVPKLEGVVTGPDWFKDLYGRIGGLNEWRSANMSPSFPSVARVLLRMYLKATGERLDGVIAMDPFVVQQLTRGTGPVRAEGLDVDVGPDNAERVLLHDIYVEFAGREDEQNAYLRDLVDQLWKKLGRGEVDGTELAKGLAEAIRTQHLRMFTLVPTEAKALDETGLSGDPTFYGPHVQTVFHNNFAANKIDYFIQRTQKVSVVITEDGDAQIVTTLSIANNAPRGDRSLLKKSDLNEIPSGVSRMGVFFSIPEGAEIREFFTGAIQNTFFRGLESGIYPTAWKLVDAQVQETIQLAISYTVPDMVSFVEDEGLFELTLLPQVLVNPDRLDLRVVPPDGFRMGRNEPGARYGTEPFTFEGELKAPKTLEFNLIGPDGTVPTATSLGSACA